MPTPSLRGESPPPASGLLHAECEPTSVSDARPPVETVFVYDGECRQCSHAATSFQAVARLAAISWHETAAQEALAAQFQAAPPAVALFDRGGGQVYGGETALRELAERAQTSALAEQFYGPEHSHEEGAIGDAGVRDSAVREADGIHALTPAARARLPALIAAVEQDDAD